MQKGGDHRLAHVLSVAPSFRPNNRGSSNVSIAGTDLHNSFFMNKQTVGMATGTLAKEAGSWNPVMIQIHATKALTWFWVLPGDRKNG